MKRSVGSGGDLLVLGAQLRGFRKLRSLTVRAAAAELALTPGYLSRIENGKDFPSALLLPRLADVYRVRLLRLVKLTKAGRLALFARSLELEYRHVVARALRAPTPEIRAARVRRS